MKQTIKFIFLMLIVSTSLFSQTMDNGILTYDGLERTFNVYVPDSHSERILIVLHGHGGSKEVFGSQVGDDPWGFQAKANLNGTVIVFVDGVPSDGSRWPLGARGWNAYHCCGQNFENKVDDVGFISYLIDYLKYTYGITHVAVLGFSNGGMMAHRLAAELWDKISALVDFSGCIGGQSDVYPNEIRMPSSFPLNRISVVMAHGKKDPVVTYDNSWPSDKDRIDLPFETGVKFWKEAGGYDSENTDIPVLKIKDAEIKIYTSSQPEPIRDRHGIMTIVFPEAGHETPNWPTVLDIVWRFLVQTGNV